MTRKHRIFSGIQPSGKLHLGNYLGAIEQWVELQKHHESFFCIVDLHAITVRQNSKELRETIRRTAAAYLACGVDPSVATIFVQSQVPAHAELAWILSTFTQMGELERMIQYKEKAREHKENVNAGLFMYPALMAADILLYRTDFVPVGEDQKQHVELARDIALRFNNFFNKEIFVIPRALEFKAGTRIMGLDDPMKKMSKSAKSPMNYDAFFDDAATVRNKIMKAVTDSGTEIKAGEDKPALTNLLTIYSLLTHRSIGELEHAYRGKGYQVFKQDLAKIVIAWLTPMQRRFQEFFNDKKELDRILTNGAEHAHKVAKETLTKVQEVVGLGYKKIK